MTVKFDGGLRRSRHGAVALGLAAAVVAAFADPAAALNTFNSQWADSTWTNSGGKTNVVRMAPGQDNHNGAITQYLNTTITGQFCLGGNSGFRLDTSLAPLTEQATLLAGVTMLTGAAKPTAKVSRVTTFTGTVTKTPTKGKACETVRGAAVTTTNPTITLVGSWSMPRGTTIVTYSGTDCGGTGTCRYIPAAATGSLVFDATTFALGGTGSEKWMWSGDWDLDALCSPVAGYPCS